jgi:hypothetical protein
LWTFPQTFPEDTIFAKYGHEGQTGWGMGKTVVVGDGGLATKEEGKEDKRRRKKFVIGEKLIGIIFDQSVVLPNFLGPT